MSVLFMFPGQGSQRAGMLHALPDDPAVAQTLTEAGDVLGVVATNAVPHGSRPQICLNTSRPSPRGTTC